ncbi:1-deoxy-D-xylulose-5-phosphate synthase [Faecalitalea cylindroides]|uniref:1-deoxy-D-xylulose-5-phosphate synthase n=1 Tax=Faecalitalea cylindroides TaxID=39483 RepID=UPI000B36EDC5|nr:1-deoxy-D-xylulose-5-phosphate synthase [Faecalitalea cylindroides]OUN63790.1 1-deoxy-D-xylulose-5-phosphate synthase [Faecalitalea cylindroides]
MRIYDIESPKQIKNMSIPQLVELSNDIRSFLISSISKTGGHLSSNLGVVELSIAMHYVFDAPNDKLIFDVGHQCYTHKILTGRSRQFTTLRKKDGLSGYQKRSESIYDCWEAGHSSTSLSAALGYAIARDIKKENYEVVALIGDGALSGGMAMEALNDIGSKQKKMIIIFNDNNMSISRNHGGIEQRITSVRSSHIYRGIKHDIKSNLQTNKVGTSILNAMTSVRDIVKHDIINAGLFQDFNLDYIGPVDGHNISDLIKVLNTAKEHDGPIVVHVLTKKGKGYPYAEKDKVGKWHGVSPFDIETGRSLMKLPNDELTWSEIISRTLMDLARKDKNIVAITPAMAQGSKLLDFEKTYPNRFFDCGIAEQHAITMACGMAAGGLKPFVSVYSSFLQRAYDQINHDMARMDLPVVVGIDRAGLVGDDGDTHQGVFDISMLRSIPNLILSQPHDAKEAQNLLYTAFVSQKPFCIRYPRGNVHYDKVDQYELIPIGSWTRYDVGDKPICIVISYGYDVDNVIHKAKENNISMIVINARFFKPIDTIMIDELCSYDLPIYVYETDCKIGSLSSAILEYINTQKHILNTIGIEDHFVNHGSIRTLRIQEHIDTQSLFKEIIEND